MFQCTPVQSEKSSPSALPDAVIQFNPPCLSFNPNYALKPPRSCLLQSHNSWRAAVSSWRLMWWKRRQLQSHKTALISSLKLIMWWWRDAAPLCVLSVSSVSLWCVLLYSRSLQRRTAALVTLFYLTRQHLCFSGGSDWHQRWAAEWQMNSSSSAGQRQCWDLQR